MCTVLRSIKVVCSYPKSHWTIKFFFKLLGKLFLLHHINKTIKKYIICLHTIQFFLLIFIAETLAYLNIYLLHYKIRNSTSILNVQIYIDQVIPTTKIFNNTFLTIISHQCVNQFTRAVGQCFFLNIRWIILIIN